MNYIDYLIVAGFFLTMIALGFYYKKSQVAQDYFLGGKRFGWFSLAMSAMLARSTSGTPAPLETLGETYIPAIASRKRACSKSNFGFVDI